MNNAERIHRYYIEQGKPYGDIFPIEKVMLYFGFSTEALKEIMNSKYCRITNEAVPFRIMFTTLPSWGTGVKSYRIGGLTYTHIQIIKV